jgi:hypothetical protein
MVADLHGMLSAVVVVSNTCMKFFTIEILFHRYMKKDGT